MIFQEFRYFDWFFKMHKMEILKIRELLRALAGTHPSLDTKTMRKSTELIESFIFCRRSPLNSRSSQQERSAKLGNFPKNQPKSIIFHDFSGFSWFFKKILIFQEFRYLAQLHRWCPTRVGGGRRRPGIGPQGRQSVLRHSAQARDIVGTDPDGLQSP